MTASHQVLRSVVIQCDPQLGTTVSRALRAHRCACHLVATVSADLDLEPFRNCQLVVVDLDAVGGFYGRFVGRVRSELPNARLLLLSVDASRYPRVEAAGIPLEACVVDPHDTAELRDKLARAIAAAQSQEPARSAAAAGPGAAPAGPGASTGEPAAPARLKVRGRGPIQRPASATLDRIEAPAYVIVLGGIKGGTGKSTLAINLVGALLHEDLTVASIDLAGGPASLTHYLENRRRLAAVADSPPPLPKHAVIEPGEGETVRFETALLALRETSDFLVIDTPAAETALSRIAHSWADSLITPVNDSFLDLAMLARVGEDGEEALPGGYFELVYRANLDKLRREARPINWIVVPNRMPSLPSRNGRAVGRLLSRLAEALGFQVGPELRERVVYRELFDAGLVVADLRDAGGEPARPRSLPAARQELAALRAMIGASRPMSAPKPAATPGATRIAV